MGGDVLWNWLREEPLIVVRDFTYSGKTTQAFAGDPTRVGLYVRDTAASGLTWSYSDGPSSTMVYYMASTVTTHDNYDDINLVGSQITMPVWVSIGTNGNPFTVASISMNPSKWEVYRKYVNKLISQL